MSISNSLKQLYQLNLRLFDSFPVQGVPIGVSPGRSAWHVMLVRKPLQMSRSRSSGYRTLLPLLSVSISLEDGSTSASMKQEAFIFVSSTPVFHSLAKIPLFGTFTVL
jgi:hypothetical protein